MKNVLLAGVLVAMLSGCASVPMASATKDAEAKEFRVPPEGKSGLYIFRDSFVGQALNRTTHLDGELTAASAPDVNFY